MDISGRRQPMKKIWCLWQGAVADRARGKVGLPRSLFYDDDLKIDSRVSPLDPSSAVRPRGEMGPFPWPLPRGLRTPPPEPHALLCLRRLAHLISAGSAEIVLAFAGNIDHIHRIKCGDYGNLHSRIGRLAELPLGPKPARGEARVRPP